MIEITVLAAAGLAAGTLLALVLGGGLLRSRRDRARLREEITGLRDQLDDARSKTGRVSDEFTAEIAHLTEKRLPRSRPAPPTRTSRCRDRSAPASPAPDRAPVWTGCSTGC